MARQPLDLFLSHCRNINPFSAAFSCRGRAERCREAFRAGCSKGSFEFLKTQKANNSKASQSPWNWPDGLGPSFLMLTKAVSTLLRGHLEEAKASKAFWKRHFQPVRRPADCALPSGFPAPTSYHPCWRGLRWGCYSLWVISAPEGDLNKTRCSLSCTLVVSSFELSSDPYLGWVKVSSRPQE